MGELWRSQEMQLVQLFIQIEAAHDTVDELGKLGLIEFRDLNPTVNAFQRNFINEVKRADEMERKLRFFASELEDYNKKVFNTGRVLKPAPQKEDLTESFQMHELEENFDEYEKRLVEMNKNQEGLHRNYNQLVELKHVLEKDEAFFKQAGQQHEEERGTDIEEAGLSSRALGFISGVVSREKFTIFERILFRITRGNIFMKFAEIVEDIEDPFQLGIFVKKNVFIIFYHGSTAISEKIKKICEPFNANLYTCPERASERKILLEQVISRIADLKVLLATGETQKSQILSTIAQSLHSWTHKVKQEKGIYHTMNKFNYDVGRKCLIAEGWVPKDSLETVNLHLMKGTQRSGSTVGSIINSIQYKDEPPTYFKTNKFTSGFQALVDSYGIARYREINPAVLTIVTFPYEFGIMFGDVGHGIILLLFAILMIYKERDWEGKKVHEMIEMFYSGRYLILLMSLFSIYQGALYNEMFSQPMNFGSNWVLQVGPQFNNNTFTRVDTNISYAFGVDPVWKGATNELLYYNSVKMKMAIIVGVIQMTTGIFFHLLNSLYFKNYLDLFFEFIPRILFLLSIFGYLCVMIFIKWSIDYPSQDLRNAQRVAALLNDTLYNNGTAPYNITDFEVGTQGAPVLLNELIFMILPPPPGQSDNLFVGQASIQSLLLAIAFICVPIMLLPKPFILLYWNKKNQRHAKMMPLSSLESKETEGDKLTEFQTGKSILDDQSMFDDTDEVGHGGGHGHGHDGEFNFSEIFVHQILETIEFVLGSVSHTASYLRLWALSLAHSELATVFWGKIMFMLLSMAPLAGSNWFATGIMAFLAQSIWFFVTLLVMMFMEGLSAFLHALRLHWVEFQSKFFKGDGHPFLPFSYERILSGQDEEIE